jgi:ubiquinone/menaquinone biosynthesis C-methylase UbiE
VADPGHVDTFNRIAPVYDARYARSCEPAYRLAIDAAADSAPGTVLDIGCGTGLLLRDVRKRWSTAKLFGVDPAARMIDVARNHLPDAVLTVGGAESLPLSDGSVDLVLSTTSFGHWAAQELGLREVARVLSPTGRCVIVEHAPPGFAVKLVLRLTNHLPVLHAPEALAAMADRAGLEVRRCSIAPKKFVVLVAGRGEVR